MIEVGEITGFDEVDARLRMFDVKNMNTVMMQTFRKATKPMVQEMKALAPIGESRNLVDSIGQVIMRDGNGILVGSRVNRGYKGWLGPVYEFGSGMRKKKSGASTGRVTRHRWLSSGYENSIDYVNSIIDQELVDAVNRIWRKKTIQ
jgi:hypothetical protein